MVVSQPPRGRNLGDGRWGRGRAGEGARVASLTVLDNAEEVQFKFIEEALGLTRGNLSSHVSKLEEAGLLSVSKSVEASR
jgi:DNA-binding MarR family transcriptional regulator